MATQQPITVPQQTATKSNTWIIVIVVIVILLVVGLGIYLLVVSKAKKGSEGGRDEDGVPPTNIGEVGENGDEPEVPPPATCQEVDLSPLTPGRYELRNLVRGIDTIAGVISVGNTRFAFPIAIPVSSNLGRMVVDVYSRGDGFVLVVTAVSIFPIGCQTVGTLQHGVLYALPDDSDEPQLRIAFSDDDTSNLSHEALERYVDQIIQGLEDNASYIWQYQTDCGILRPVNGDARAIRRSPTQNPPRSCIRRPVVMVELPDNIRPDDGFSWRFDPI